jgi:hypothetical protein
LVTKPGAILFTGMLPATSCNERLQAAVSGELAFGPAHPSPRSAS